MNKNVIFALICIVIIISSVSYIGCSVSKKKQQAKQQSQAEFEQDVRNSLSAYRDIDHIVVDDKYVGVYVNKDTWNNSSKDIQDQFVKEIYALVRIEALQNNLLEDGITLSFYTSDREDIGLYLIKEEKI